MTAAQLYPTQTIDVALDDAVERISAAKREDPLAPEVRLLEDTSAAAPALEYLWHTFCDSDVTEFAYGAPETLDAVAAPAREEEVR